MAIKNIAGQPVRGKDFFDRPALVSEFRQKISSGSSILISAPRRVGKTSLMYRVHDNGMEDFYFIHMITESINSENEYFKHILHRILDTEFLNIFEKKSKKAYHVLKDWAGRISEIGIKKIKFEPGHSLDYRQEFIKLIKEIDLEGKRLVLMVDEFSQTVENIIEDEGKRQAIHFLQSNRELRQSEEITRKLQFVFAGSIGLENIVSRLNSVNLINDLVSLKVPPLSALEAKQLISEITESMPFLLSKENMDYILEKIQWLIPYYIQLTVQQISDLYRGEEGTKKQSIPKKNIDEAFSKMLELRNCFEHWNTRLRKAFKKEEYTFAKELLNIIAEKENIRKADTIALAQKLNASDEYKDIINALVYDGYINHNDEPQVYRFNSPLLKMWWWKNVAY